MVLLLRGKYSIAAVRVFMYVCVSIVSSLAKFQENPLINIHQTLLTSLVKGQTKLFSKSIDSICFKLS